MKSLLVGLGVSALVVCSAPTWANLSPYADRETGDDDLVLRLDSPPVAVSTTDLPDSPLGVIAALTDDYCEPEPDDAPQRQPYDASLALEFADKPACASEVDWIYPAATDTPGTVIVNGVIRSEPAAGDGDRPPFGIDVRSIIRSGNGALELLAPDAAGSFGPEITERVVTLRLAPMEPEHSAASIPGSGTLAVTGIGLLALGLMAWWRARRRVA